MSPSAQWEIALLVAPFVATSIAALFATALAHRVRWVDGGAGAHKIEGNAWPLSGGAAVTAGLIVAWALVEAWGREHATFAPGRALAVLLGEPLGRDVTLWPFGAVATAFAVGAIDDGLEDGLGALPKLFGQASCGFVLGAPILIAAPHEFESYLAVAALVAGAVVALNAVNTFDNADGAALGLAALALAPTAGPLAAATLGFAPFNLRRDRAGAWRRKAILGDAGSHVLGVLILFTPASWPVLALPLADLARVSLERVRLGLAPWRGDRRHLAHRLEPLGWAPWRVALALVVVAAPSALGAASGRAEFAALGVVVTLAAFAVAVRRAPAAPAGSRTLEKRPSDHAPRAVAPDPGRHG